MTTPHRCPCCDGWGKRSDSRPLLVMPDPVPCPACQGTGALWEPEDPGQSVTVGPAPPTCAVCGEPFVRGQHVCLVRRESTQAPVSFVSWGPAPVKCAVCGETLVPSHGCLIRLESMHWNARCRSMTGDDQ